MSKAADIAGVREGEILAGKYRVDRVLGIGGMGVVVAAHHLKLDERVAIKFLLPEALGNAEAVVRFEREARAAVKIKSEHVARIIDVGMLENGAPYMVMEYLEGGDLATWVQQRGPLPIEQAVEFVLQTCEAVAEAHGQGIVHRDLKPANLFCIRRSDGVLSVKVLDFGISKLTTLSASGPDMMMTKTSAVMGSPLYMSPEQMQSSRSVDTRTDIWAIGVVLYELLTGEAPFQGDTMPALVLKIAGGEPESLRMRRLDAPPGLEAIISKCLEKDRTRRYVNVAELAVALAEFGPKRARASAERASRILQAAGLSASALTLPPSSDPDSPPQGTQASWGQTKRRTRWGSTKLSVAVVVIGTAGTAALAWSRWSGRAAYPVTAESQQATPTPANTPTTTLPTALPSPEFVHGEAQPAEPTPSNSTTTLAHPSASAAVTSHPRVDPGASVPARVPRTGRGVVSASGPLTKTPPAAAPAATATDPFANPK